MANRADRAVPVESGFVVQLARWIATGSFAGYFPFAPATFTSFLVVLLFFFLPPIGAGLFTWILVALFFAGVWSATIVERIHGEDAKQIVVDEVLGMGTTLFLAPKQPVVYLAAFFLFRFFDIVKPWPIRRLESLPRGWGIVMDDAVAGIFSCLALHAGLRLASGFGIFPAG